MTSKFFKWRKISSKLHLCIVGKSLSSAPGICWNAFITSMVNQIIFFSTRHYLSVQGLRGRSNNLSTRSRYQLLILWRQRLQIAMKIHPQLSISSIVSLVYDCFDEFPGYGSKGIFPCHYRWWMSNGQCRTNSTSFPYVFWQTYWLPQGIGTSIRKKTLSDKYWIILNII